MVIETIELQKSRCQKKYFALYLNILLITTTVKDFYIMYI